MANTKSSKKDLRRSAKKRIVNQSVRSGLKTYVKKARTAASTGENVQEALASAVSALDKAVQRGIIHKNQAARRKARVAKLAHAAASGGGAKAEVAEAKPTKAKKAEGKATAAKKPATKAAAKPTAKPAAPKTAAKAKKAPAAE